MKHFSLKRIRDIFPQFNERPIGEADFWRVCKSSKIIVKELPLQVDGYHKRYRGRDYILLNRTLTGRKWLHTALHELCHFLFDAPTESDNYASYRRTNGDPADPRERFADAFALVCMIPFADLERLSREDLSDDPAMLSLCADRIKVLADFKI